MKAEDRIGTIVNGWKILEIVRRDKSGHIIFKAQHVTTMLVIESTYSHLKQKKTTRIVKRTMMSNERIYGIYKNMQYRCYHVNNARYRNYGARGIAICQEWLDNPKSFEEWALESGYNDNLTIDRIDVNGDYCPQNCRWISSSENSKWTRRSYKIWIGIYCDTGQGWSSKVQKSENWFSHIACRRGYDYAYQKLLDRIEELGGIKKVMGISEEEPDISQILKDIDDDCLEIDF